MVVVRPSSSTSVPLVTRHFPVLVEKTCVGSRSLRKDGDVLFFEKTARVEV